MLEMGLKELLNRSEVGRQCIAANSMRGYGRDLTGVEQIQVKRGNADGKYLNKAGSRAIDEQTRNARRAKEDERIAKAQRDGNLPMPIATVPSLPAILPRTGAGSQPGESRKRDRSDDEEDSEGSEAGPSMQQRPQKRLRTARNESSRFSDDDDLAMFDQAQLVIEDADVAQRYPLRASAREEVIYEEDGEEASDDSLFGDGGESSDEILFGDGEVDVDDEFAEAGAENDEDDDPYVPDKTPVSTTKPPSVHDDEHEANVDDEHTKPETATRYPIPEDPYHQPTTADNVEAGLSDLEGHRRWVREMLYEDPETYTSSIQPHLTAQPPSRYQNAIDPLTPSDATASQTDFSEVAPSTNKEVASLAVALLPTKKMFWEWTGQTVPQPDRGMSYGDQYRELHKAFKEWWNENAEGPMPILVRVRHWGEAVDQWEAVEKNAVYYEAYKRGHRAPRDEYGRMVHVPGPLLEKFGDIF